MRLVSGLAAALVVTSTASLTAQSPRAIVGHWSGESICVRASWNAACHDEHVVYDVNPLGADSMRVHVEAFKIVAGRTEPMYGQDLTYDPRRHAWLGEFRNARVRILWRYELRGAELDGRLTMIPSGALARTIRVHRSTPAAP